MSKLINFLKYNNATILIIAAIFITGAGVFAAENPDALGQKQSNVQGIDNTLLLTADLPNLNMDFTIKNITEDDLYYYVNYSFLDLDILDNAWQYALKEKTWKLSKKLKQDLGIYLAGKFSDMRVARIKVLEEKQTIANLNGETKRVEVIEYSGLVGKVLDTASNIFPGYEAKQENEIPSPEFPESIDQNNTPTAVADNLTNVYNNYVATHPEIIDALDNATPSSTPTITPADIIVPTTTPEEADIASTTPDIIISTTTEQNVEIMP